MTALEERAHLALLVLHLLPYQARVHTPHGDGVLTGIFTAPGVRYPRGTVYVKLDAGDEHPYQPYQVRLK